MPSFAHLTDAEIADTLTYALNAWGNAGGSIGAEQVAAARGGKTQAAAKAGTSTPEAKYQGAPSTVTVADTQASAAGGLPPLSDDERKRSAQIFFERCAGCHGVLRKGATGKPLTPDITRAKGTDYLKALINFGSPAGMP
ncbi:MAG: cytochrome c, partial [Xanthomonadales bacterium]|nr:cytochrome c [Xanthomonadales bacterium]